MSTLDKRILRDIAVAQTTADCIAQRLKKPQSEIDREIQQLLTDEKITSHQVADTLTVYRLTHEGRHSLA